MNRCAIDKRKSCWVVIIVFVLLGVLSVQAARAECIYSNLSQSRPSFVQYNGGYTLAVQSAYLNRQPTAHLWENGVYAGQYAIPLTLFEGQVVIVMRGKFVYETRNGMTQSVWKLVPAVGVCAQGWQIIPAY